MRKGGEGGGGDREEVESSSRMIGRMVRKMGKKVWLITKKKTQIKLKKY